MQLSLELADGIEQTKEKIDESLKNPQVMGYLAGLHFNPFFAV